MQDFKYLFRVFKNWSDKHKYPISFGYTHKHSQHGEFVTLITFLRKKTEKTTSSGTENCERTHPVGAKWSRAERKKEDIGRKMLFSQSSNILHYENATQRLEISAIFPTFKKQRLEYPRGQWNLCLCCRTAPSEQDPNTPGLPKGKPAYTLLVWLKDIFIFGWVSLFSKAQEPKTYNQRIFRK